MEGKGKGRKKGRKESSFPAPEWLLSSPQGKERNPPEPQCFQGIRRKEREKEEERDGFRIRFLRGIQGKKDGGKEGKRKEESSFSVLQRLFFSPEKERNPVVSREGEGKEGREKR